MDVLCELGVHTAAPGRLPDLTRAYAQRSRQDSGSLLGAWTCEFGLLSRLVTLRCPATHQAEEDPLPGQIAVERRLLRAKRDIRRGVACKIVELRTYSTQAGQRDDYLARMLPALAWRERHSPNIGVWVPCTGNLDEVIHLWGYEDLAHRMRARAASFEDPDWTAYLPTVYPMLTRMQSEIMIPTSFSPLQ